uniref:Uncharacterized protein n=1 Tax=Arundo donax TaxID=35708 RepID=A0A0A8Y858_ARUDO
MMVGCSAVLRARTARDGDSVSPDDGETAGPRPLPTVRTPVRRPRRTDGAGRFPLA